MSGSVKKSDLSQLADMVNGFQQSCVLVAALRVGMVDVLAEAPLALEPLADRLGLHAPTLKRLLRALASLGLVCRQSDRWALSGKGQLLRKDGRAAALRAWAELVGREYLAAWGGLAHSLRTGQAAFPEVFGMTAWEHRSRHPDIDDAFQRVTRGEQALAVSALLRAYDFQDCRVVVDVGGGHGVLVAGVLAAHAGLRGILFDLPHVIEGAAPLLRQAGLDQRCRVVAGSFLEKVPEGGDLYLLKHILHNWDDETCRGILRRCAHVMGKGARLLVLENILPDESEEADPRLLMLDLHMLAVLGGRERSEAEFRSLFADSGLCLTRRLVTRQGAPDILEAVPL